MSLLATIKGLFGFGSKGPGAMGPGDRLLDCEDCKQQFVFDAGEQKFFKEKGFTDPKRCPKCRKRVRSRMRRRRGRGGGGGGGGEGEGAEQARSNNHHNERGGNQNGGGRGRGGRGRGGRRHSVIDGDSPYADER
jgi:hypothetical protein